ncbi:MAG: hypothetical protein BWY17_02270 [Deltaproteobacteria bacterium ADurb.Bin207]|nr:MAG: hypothetical protein BWY17_02270 [Deltaproteobacteria bacterium ADurb.Bin207]
MKEKGLRYWAWAGLLLGACALDREGAGYDIDPGAATGGAYDSGNGDVGKWPDTGAGGSGATAAQGGSGGDEPTGGGGSGGAEEGGSGGNAGAGGIGGGQSGGTGGVAGASGTGGGGTGGSGGEPGGSGGGGAGGTGGGGAGGTGGVGPGGTGGGGLGGTGGAATVDGGTPEKCTAATLGLTSTLFAECDTCMQEYCQDTCIACAKNPDCKTLVQCVFKCSNDQCKKNCWKNNEDGQDDAKALAGKDGCLDTNCDSKCPDPPDPSWCSIQAVKSHPSSHAYWLALALVAALIHRRSRS